MLEKCLNALNGQINTSHQIIVMNAGSTDGMIEYLQGVMEIHLVCDDKPIGQAPWNSQDPANRFATFPLLLKPANSFRHCFQKLNKLSPKRIIIGQNSNTRTRPAMTQPLPWDQNIFCLFFSHGCDPHGRTIKVWFQKTNGTLYRTEIHAYPTGGHS